MTRASFRLLLASAALSAAPVGPALAQDASQVEEVIVTAEKREARLQDVPVSVTVVGQAQLDALNVASGTEIARQTPNLRVSNLGNEDQPKFSMRGIATPDFNLNTTSPTGVFYDEVYVASQFLGGPQIFDLERVEVLRGPQGTLFGKNTTGGAINFITRKPSFDFGGDVTVQVGNNEYWKATGAVNAPLIDDRLAARLAFNASQSNGWVKNHNPAGEDLSSIDNYALRLSLLFTPTDDFEAVLKIDHSRAEPTNIGTINVGLGPNGTNAFGVNPRVHPLTGQPFDNHEGYYDRTDGEIIVEGDGATLTMRKGAGPYSFTSITNYTEGFFLNRVDGDGSIAPLLAIDFYADTSEWSQDLRVATDYDGPFNFIAGLYFSHDEVGIRTDWWFFGGALERFQRYDQERSSWAAYFDGSYDFSDQLSLYGGIRWTHDEGEISNFRVTGAGAPPIAPQPTKSFEDSAPTGRIGLRAKFTEDVMGYVQYARGYRSSAINGGALFNPADVNISDPEYLDSYEIGLKTQLFDRRLTLNSSAFFYKYIDQQFINTVTVGQSNVVNAGEARLYGLEVEAVAQLTPELTLRAGGALLSAEYTELSLAGNCSPRLVAIGDCAASQAGAFVSSNLAGNRLIEAPERSFNAALDYRRPLGDDQAITFHADVNWVDEQYFTPRNDPLSLLPAFSEWNAEVGYERGPLRVAIWGKNLSDNDSPGGIVGPDFDTFLQIFRTPVYPRRYGVELSYRF
ncbi:TonB-dependent receptor [Phenylobacterium sp.]|uniref:TonB-dependent receptor n=1 Tax=Phenylobacterium sp. TaxID=1871053 RepID=UPI002E36F529|nr:TonB-dependent receptor [Phenylobacterium sp.]HEX2558814.1 TonB-dependent receptor [Phenylobacterium sp.]